MQTLSLETILMPEDIKLKVQLCCLACRRRMAALNPVRHEKGDAEDASLPVAVVPHGVRDFQQNRHAIVLTCVCGVKSIFHLL